MFNIESYYDWKCRKDIPVEVNEIEAPPADAEVLPLDRVKLQLRLDDDLTDEDALVTDKFDTAIEHVQSLCGVSMLPRKVTVYMPRWPTLNVSAFPIRPVRMITEIRYINEQGQSVILPNTEYRVRPTMDGVMISPAYNKSWPNLHDEEQFPVEVDAEVGYEVGEVPRRLVEATLLLTGDLYENRESQGVSTRIYSSMFDNKTFNRLLANFRLRRL